MIDCEKLKMAHTLTSKIHLGKLAMFYSEHDGVEYYFSYAEPLDKNYYLDIDDLIAKLRELTQPEAKYKVGDTIWFSNQHMAIDYLKIESIDIVENDIFYRGNGCQVALSDKIYSSKNELIDAQIEKLRKMKYE